MTSATASSRVDNIRRSLVGLRVPRALEMLDATLRQIEQGQIDGIEAIDELLTEELSPRESRRIKAALHMASLPIVKTLAGFEFSFQPSLDRNRIIALAFINRAEVIHLLGPAGTAKSHLATALAVEAVRAGRSVYFIPLADHHDPGPCSRSTGTRNYLAKRWSAGVTFGRDLLAEIRERGYTGSLTHLQRLLRQWRCAHFAAVSGPPAAQQERSVTAILHPANAAALCIKPRGQLTAKQVATLDRLKQVSSDFAVMRRLTMRLRGILRGGGASRLESWLNDALASGIHWMRQLVITLKRDIDALSNAVTYPWSNGQTEGQINKLKTLKPTMYRRAGIDLLRARPLPIHPTVSRAI